MSQIGYTEGKQWRLIHQAPIVLPNDFWRQCEQGWVAWGRKPHTGGGTEAVDTCLQVVLAADRGTWLEYTFIGFSPS